MREDPRAQVDALADVQQGVALAVEAVDPRTLGKLIHDAGVQLLRERPHRQQGGHGGGKRRLGPLRTQRGPEIDQHPGITERAVARAAVKAVTRHHRIEVVAVMFGVQSPRQFHRAQHFRVEVRAETPELAAQERIVKPGIVRDEHRAAEPAADLGGNLRKGGRGRDHLVADAGERLYIGGNAAFRVDQRAPFLDRTVGGQPHDADLSDAVMRGVAASGLQVDEHQFRRQAGGFSRAHLATGSGNTGPDAGRGTRPMTRDGGGSGRGRTWR